jgi:glycosidase
MKHVIFLDNHDITRFLSQVGEDKEKLKSGIAWLLTCRGIPQMYYGTEVMMKGISNPDGWVRLDFPGGWDGDKKNAFTRKGLNDDFVPLFSSCAGPGGPSFFPILCLSYILKSGTYRSI